MVVINNSMIENMRITVFADPVSTWCWGSVPVIRALKYRYGEQLVVSYVMGGMVEDISTYSNRRLAIGGDIALSNRNIHEHWLEASAIHGMPVSEGVSTLFSEERRSSVPLNKAYIAAKVYAREYECEYCDTPGRYLRLLQELTAVERFQANSEDNLVAISAVLGFDHDKFERILLSEEVGRLYDEGKELCGRYEVHAFPTYKLEYRGEEMMLRGFTTFETLSHRIRHLSYDNIRPIDDGRERPSAKNVRNFVAEYGTAYPVEIATAFSLARSEGHTALNVESYQGLPDVVEELVSAGEMAMSPKGNGFVCYTLKENRGFLHPWVQEPAEAL